MRGKYRYKNALSSVQYHTPPPIIDSLFDCGQVNTAFNSFDVACMVPNCDRHTIYEFIIGLMHGEIIVICSPFHVKQRWAPRIRAAKGPRLGVRAAGCLSWGNELCLQKITNAASLCIRAR